MSFVITPDYKPSDTKLLLTKNIVQSIFQKLQISRAIPPKVLSFLEIVRVQNPSKTAKNNSQGIFFVIISCPRALDCYTLKVVWENSSP